MKQGNLPIIIQYVTDKHAARPSGSMIALKAEVSNLENNIQYYDL
jgi:hypothetical protein